MARDRLGEILIRAGLLDEAGLQRALNEQSRWGGQVGRYLVELGLITEEILVRALSTQYNLPAVAIDPEKLSIKIARIVPQEICERRRLVCFRADAEKRFIDVAMADPSDMDAIDEVRVATRLNVRPYIAGPSAIDRAITFVFYGEIQIGGQLDLSPDSPLRSDARTGSELLDKARGVVHAPPGAAAAAVPGGQGRGTVVEPASAAAPALEVKVTSNAAPSPGDSAALPPTNAARAPGLRPPGGPVARISLPRPRAEDGFHITMDIPAVEKEMLTGTTVEDRLSYIEAIVERNSAVLEAVLTELVKKGLFSTDEIRRALGLK